MESADGRELGVDFDPGAIGHHLPDFVHFPVSQRNAALRPVQLRMTNVLSAPIGWQTVDHDLAAGVDAKLGSAGPITLIRIRDMQSPIKLRSI